jgi:hypothetical protein
MRKTIIVSSLLAAGCSGLNALAPAEPEPRSARNREYSSVVLAASSEETDYSGLHNTFSYRATLLTQAVRRAQLRQIAQAYLWEPGQLATEIEKADQENASETRVFLSFYTPERRNDNLADSKSIWRVLLEIDQTKIAGQVRKSKQLLAELQSLYPFHTRWNTPYIVTFPVAMRGLEGRTVKLTVTGPLGSRTVDLASAPAAPD